MNDKGIELDKQEDLEELEESSQEVSMEEIMQAMGSSIQPMELDISNLCDMQFDEKEFFKGLYLISKYAGMVTGLINAGLSSHDALDFITNERTIEMNLRLNAENNKTSLEVSKYQAMLVDKSQL